jgi:osmotically inducible protein OsmC
MKRTSTAVWQGTGKEGKGTLSTQSGALRDNPYAWVTRFENSPGTNPEELIAAAHAGCFSMKLAFNITKAGFTPDRIETSCEITLDPAKNEVTDSKLNVKVKSQGLDQAKFTELAHDAKKNCPISKLLKCNIELVAMVE